MKIKWMVVCLLISDILFAQSFIQNETDKFTGQKRLKTSEERLYAKGSKSLHVYLRSVDSTYFLTVTGIGPGADIIGEQDKMIFLLSTDQTVTVYPTGIQSYDVGQYTNSFRHQYYVTKEQIEQLSRHKLKSIRKYGSGHYNDLDVPEKNSDVVMKLCGLMLKEIEPPKESKL